MGCCPFSGLEDRNDGEREEIISQNVAESYESVRELKYQVDNYNIEIKNLKEKLRQAENKNEEKQRNCDALVEKIAQFKSTISELEKLCEDLKTEKQTLLTRLSQISAVKLIDSNPNIADLSEPNPPDKLAEQFSELYDNQWTDSFQVLCERLGLSDEDAIQVLLKIVLTVYDLCRQQVEYQNNELGKALCTFTGVEVVDQANESVIQESLHNLRSFRARKYNLAIDVLQRKIGDSLQSIVGSNVYIACQVYIAECIKVSWLMCVKVPSMYISAKTEDVFNHDLYTSYTKSGIKMFYVVWPTLFQYENGPKLKKGIAQGIS